MSWLAWAGLGLHLVLAFGPLRRPFWRGWRFTLPASICGWIGGLVASGVSGPGDPWWAPGAVGVFVALAAGTTFKQWLDEALGGVK